MKNKGFTLVEIIAVIVIMGILLLIVVPATSNLMRSNEEQEYVTYYEILEKGLEKYGRTRRNDIGGSNSFGCIDDKDVKDLVKLGYAKEFDQEEDVVCGTPKEFDINMLQSWGIDTSKEYVNMFVEGNYGTVKVKISLICVKKNSNGTYASEPEYIKLIETKECGEDIEVIPNTTQFDIHYHYEGGVAPLSGVPSKYTYGIGATVNGEPTKENNIFNGWNNGSTTLFSHTITGTDRGDKNFTAEWCQNCAPTGGATCTLNANTPGSCVYTTGCPEEYTIKNGGTYNPSCVPNVYAINYEGGGALSNTGTPRSYSYGVGATIDGDAIKFSYTFNGWEYENQKKMKHTITTTDKGDKTLTALWCRNCAATGGASCELNASIPGTCTYTTSCPDGYTLTNNGKYNPNCSANSYTINYEGGGTLSSNGTPKSYTYGVGATINGTASLDNHTFNGWKLGSSNKFEQKISKTDIGNKTVTALWCHNCEASGGASCNLNASTAGTCTYTTSCPEGYEISNNGKYNPSCTAKTYTIAYEGGGTLSSNGTPRSYTYGVGATIDGTASLSDYTFNGWQYGLFKKYSVSISSTEMGNKTVTALWCRNCAATGGASCNLNANYAGSCSYTTTCPPGYTISNSGKYNPHCSANSYPIKYEGGGTLSSNGTPRSYDYGVGATVNGTATLANYTFNGWRYGSQNSFSQIIPGTATGEKTMTALWCQNCEASGGASCELNASTAGTCTYTTSCPEGYEISNNGQYNPSCTAKTYNINYAGGGTLSTYGTPRSYTYGIGATVDGTASLANYTFNGWQYGTEKSYNHAISRTDTGEKTMTALWCQNCEASGGASCELNVNTAGTCTYITSCPEGYEISNNGQYNPSCTVQTYTLSYNLDGGTGDSCTSITKNYNEPWGTLCEPTKAGFTFEGWYYDSTRITSASLATSDITVTASWTPNNRPATLTLYKLRGNTESVNGGTWCGIAKSIEEVDKVCVVCTGMCPCVIQALGITPPTGYTLSTIHVHFNPTPSDHSEADNYWNSTEYTPEFKKYTVFRKKTDQYYTTLGERGAGTNDNFFTYNDGIVIRFRNQYGTNGISGYVDVTYSNGATGRTNFSYGVTSTGCKSYGVSG